MQAPGKRNDSTLNSGERVRQEGPQQAATLRVQHAAEPLPASGVVVFDMMLRPIASDTGAVAILRHEGGDAGDSNPRLTLPQEVLDAISSRPTADTTCLTVSVTVGTQAYRCRCYVVSPAPSAPRLAVHVVHFEADAANSDPIHRIASAYKLTEREEEALRGIAVGLTTKELAERMKISPNTVKAFVHLIMIKLGVATRTGIIAKLLDNNQIGR